jgi:hypothetical protein
MRYHIPDKRWESFDILSFEDYQHKAIVEGRFHPLVPNDIVEDFLSAEYMMAHSYYHYPLYHEALSKVLRMIEMGIKFRCRQLQIPLEKQNSSNSRVEKRPLKQLMDDLVRTEPAKDMAIRFEVSRSLRNSLMHPTQFMFSGAMSKGYIKQSITLLNTLFLPDTLFDVFKNEHNKFQKLIEPFKENVFILTASGKRYLVSRVSCESVKVGEQWQYLLVAHPVMKYAAGDLTKYCNSELFSFVVLEAVMINKSLEFACLNAEEKITIQPTNHRQNLKLYEEYKAVIASLSDIHRQMYFHHIDHQVGEITNNFLYDTFDRIVIV